MISGLKIEQALFYISQAHMGLSMQYDMHTLLPLWYQRINNTWQYIPCKLCLSSALGRSVPYFYLSQSWRQWLTTSLSHCRQTTRCVTTVLL